MNAIVVEDWAAPLRRLNNLCRAEYPAFQMLQPLQGMKSCGFGSLSLVALLGTGRAGGCWCP